ncbi:hypothetical protein GCM10027168_31250 [Streptomyces capparidis]
MNSAARTMARTTAPRSTARAVPPVPSAAPAPSVTGTTAPTNVRRLIVMPTSYHRGRTGSMGSSARLLFTYVNMGCVGPGCGPPPRADFRRAFQRIEIPENSAHLFELSYWQYIRRAYFWRGNPYRDLKR